MKTGVLLVNLGTPEAPRTPEVRRYLRQFLMDPLVVDIPPVLRWLLVNLVILPRRPAKSAEAYRKVWTERGSPLLFHTLDLAGRTQESLGAAFAVEPAMRYGKPSIESGLRRLRERGAERLVCLPLYPQYSLAATRSSVDEIKRVLGALGNRLPVSILPAFHSEPDFIEAFVRVAREALRDFPHEHLVFSFHGLPERQVRKTDPTGTHCLVSGDCCEQANDANRDCYRAQCFQSAHAIARGLGLGRERYTVAFQSRLGRTPWIRPYTDLLYPELAARGVKRIAVMSPSFVADCLETLEEIALRGREQFRGAGGEELLLVPSLNSSAAWVAAVARMVRAAGNPTPAR